MGKHPTTKRRKARQQLKERFARVRDEAEVAGVIAVSPEGGVRVERVDPATQDEQRFPGLDRAAIRNDGDGWAVPAAVKRKVIEVNAEVLYERKLVWKDDGTAVELPPNRFEQNQASKVLLAADEKQHERDHPEEAGKAKGGVKVGVQVNHAPAFSWAELTGEVPDPAQDRLDQLKEQNDGEQVEVEARPSGG